MNFLFSRCIVCFKSRGPVEHVRKQDKDGLTIHTKLQTTLPEYGLLEPIEHRYICRKCVSGLNAFIKFRKQCIANFMILHEIIQQRLVSPKTKSCVYSIITLDDISKCINLRSSQKNSENANTGLESDSAIRINDGILETRVYNITNDSKSKTDETTVEQSIRRPYFDESRHECSKCKMGFRTLEELRNYKRIHGNRMPYSCKYCLYKDASLENIKIHVQRIHPGEDQFEFNEASVHDIENTSTEIAPQTETTINDVFSEVDTVENEKETVISKPELVPETGNISENTITELELRTETTIKNMLNANIVKNEIDELVIPDIVNNSANMNTNFEFKTEMDVDNDKIYKLKITAEADIQDEEYVKKEIDEVEEILSNDSDYEPDTSSKDDDEETESIKSANTVATSVKQKRKYFHCNICRKAYTSQATFDIHKKIHEKKRPFQCKICGRRFGQDCRLKEHLRIHTEENLVKPINCKLCDFKCLKWDTVRRHNMRVHADEKVLDLDKTAGNNSENINYETDLTTQTAIKDNFKNETVDLTSITNDETNMKVIDDKNKPAPKTFEESFSKYINDKPKSVNLEPKRFKCPVCKEILSATGLKNHKMIHAGINPFHCNICDQIFTNQDSFKIHQMKHKTQSYTRSRATVSDVSDESLFGNETDELMIPDYVSNSGNIDTSVELTTETNVDNIVFVDSTMDDDTLDEASAKANNTSNPIWLNTTNFPESVSLENVIPTSEMPRKDFEKSGDRMNVEIDLQTESTIKEVSDIDIVKNEIDDLAMKTEIISGIVDDESLSVTTGFELQTKTSIKSEISDVNLDDDDEIYELPINADVFDNDAQGSASSRLFRSPCPVCKKILTAKSLRYHKLIHAGKNPFYCNICRKEYANQNSFSIHQQRHKNIRPHQCKVCEKRFMQNYSLKEHMRTHTRERPYHCTVCTYRCNTSGCLRKHMRTHTGETKKFNNTGSDLRTETTVEDVGSDVNFDDDKIHELSINDDVLDDDAQGSVSSGLSRFPCPVCKKMLTPKGLRYHKMIHAGRNPFYCKICGKEYVSQNSFSLHQRRHKNIRPYQCKVCEKRFMQNYSLKEHMRTHTRERPYHCTVCTYRCNTSGCLRKHMRTHTEETKKFNNTGSDLRTETTVKDVGSDVNFDDDKIHELSINDDVLDDDAQGSVSSGLSRSSCPVCKTMLTAKGLRYHKMIHAGRNPFYCKICKKEYANRNSFRIHQRKHRNIRPYQCNICGKSFMQNYSLKEHMRMHTRERSYHCTLCPYRFYTSGCLREHMRTHTGETKKLKNTGSDLRSETTIKDVSDVNFVRNGTDELIIPDVVGNNGNNDPNFNLTTDTDMDKLFLDLTMHEEKLDETSVKGKIIDETKLTWKNVGGILLKDSNHEPGSSSKDDNEQNESVSPENTVPTSETSILKFVWCPVCSKLISTVDFKSHELIHARKNLFSCKICKQIYADQDSLLIHLESHRKDDPLQCKTETTIKSEISNVNPDDNEDYEIEENICEDYQPEISSEDEQQKNGSILPENTVSTAASNENRFNCSVCKRRFRTAIGLKNHEMIHAGIDPFLCKICDKSLANYNSFKVHQRIHRNERPFACKLCEKTFIQKHVLKDHMKTHTGEKPFQCIVCPYKCTTRSGLYNHLRTHGIGKDESVKNHVQKKKKPVKSINENQCTKTNENVDDGGKIFVLSINNDDSNDQVTIKKEIETGELEQNSFE